MTFLNCFIFQLFDSFILILLSFCDSHLKILLHWKQITSLEHLYLKWNSVSLFCHLKPESFRESLQDINYWKQFSSACVYLWGFHISSTQMLVSIYTIKTSAIERDVLWITISYMNSNFPPTVRRSPRKPNEEGDGGWLDRERVWQKGEHKEKRGDEGEEEGRNNSSTCRVIYGRE